MQHRKRLTAQRQPDPDSDRRPDQPKRHEYADQCKWQAIARHAKAVFSKITCLLMPKSEQRAMKKARHVAVAGSLEWAYAPINSDNDRA